MSDNLISVDGHGDLARDTSTGAIVNINSSDIAEARRQKAQRQAKLKQEQELKAEVADLKSDMNQIKEMLSQLVGNTNG